MDLNEKNKKMFNMRWILSVLIGFIAFVLFSVFVNYEVERGLKSQQLEVTKAYSAYQNEVNTMFMKDFVLLKGFQVFLETYNYEDYDEEAGRYLNRLLKGESEIIRSVVIIEDTTIKWLYPDDGNQNALGVNLLDIEGQQESVMWVKENRQLLLEGPLDLLEGYKGYIGRMPIIKEDGSYWGQLGIVLYENSVNQQLTDIANRYGLDTHVINKETDDIIIENKAVLEGDPLVMSFDEEYCSWTIYTLPKSGWKRDALRVAMSEVIGLLLGLIVGFTVYHIVKINQNLKEVASKDRLTGLYNRYFLEDYQALVLSQADRYRKSVGFIVIDLAKFKDINDTYGHATGDQVLIQTANILNKVTRSNEAVFRMGGDEFLIIMPQIMSVEEVKVVEARVEESFDRSFKVYGNELFIEPTIGIGIYPKDGYDFNEVIHKTDLKMYMNKDKGSRKE